MKSRDQVAAALGQYYSEKFNGIVWAYFDKVKKAYCIRGENLPAHPDLKAQYLNGWCLLDYISPVEARRKIEAK